MPAILAWLWGSVQTIVTFLNSRFLGITWWMAQKSYVWAWIRVVAIWALLISVWNAITPPSCSTLLSCFDTYQGMVGASGDGGINVLNNIAFFVPMTLLLCLADLYIFAVTVLFFWKFTSSILSWARPLTASAP